MSVGIKVDFLWFPVGTGEFLHSFFSTISVNIEGMHWGSKFPIIMNDLYSGNLAVTDLEKAKEELQEIKRELSKLPISKVVWDAENLSKNPPWGDNVSANIKNLADYFVTNDGKNLINVIDEALAEAITEKVGLEIKSL
jgi:hypothetical protein